MALFLLLWVTGTLFWVAWVDAVFVTCCFECVGGLVGMWFWGFWGLQGVGCVSWFVCFGFGCGSSRLLTIDCGCWLPVVWWLFVDLCPEMVFCVLVLVLWFADLVVLGACNGGLGVLSVFGWVCCW